MAILGATVDLGLVWGIGNTFCGFMTVPNLIAVYLQTLADPGVFCKRKWCAAFMEAARLFAGARFYTDIQLKTLILILDKTL